MSTIAFHKDHVRNCALATFVVLQDETILYIGKIIALSILHGGPGPVFFSPAIVDYLFGGMSAVMPSIDDVPDINLQLKIKKVGCQLRQSLWLPLLFFIKLEESDEQSDRTRHRNALKHEI